MPRAPRIGIQICPTDPFWVHVREVVWRRAQATPAELLELTVERPELLSRHEQLEMGERLAGLRLDALLCNAYPETLIRRLLERGLAVVFVEESSIRHVRFTARRGLFEAAALLGAYLSECLATPGLVLAVGGHTSHGDSGQSRLDGFAAGLRPGAGHRLHHLPTRWSYADARARVAAWLAQRSEQPPAALFGLSDSLALAARDAWLAVVGTCPPPVLGINGDPLALAALTAGTMTATVETDVEDIAARAVDLAQRAACGERLPPYFVTFQRLVTAANVGEAAARRLISLTALPKELAGAGRPLEPASGASGEPCLPLEGGAGGAPARTSGPVKQALAFMQQRYGAALTRQGIAEHVGVSKDHLGRLFHEELGLSLWEYLLRYRVLRAKELLRTTDYSIAEVAARVGFPDAAYFSRLFHQRTGCSPREYRAE